MFNLNKKIVDIMTSTFLGYVIRHNDKIIKFTHENNDYYFKEVIFKTTLRGGKNEYLYELLTKDHVQITVIQSTSVNEESRMVEIIEKALIKIHQFNEKASTFKTFKEKHKLEIK